MIRQGDVLLVPCEPFEGGEDVGASYMLAEGEATGHHHTLTAAAILVKMMQDGSRFISVSGEGSLAHQEHAEIGVPARSYEVIIQS